MGYSRDHTPAAVLLWSLKITNEVAAVCGGFLERSALAGDGESWCVVCLEACAVESRSRRPGLLHEEAWEKASWKGVRNVVQSHKVGSGVGVYLAWSASPI